jgi:UDP-3-O-[3-hydroxymyristoyl] glucosamine N-acyltransferase
MPCTLADIAVWVGGTLVGDGQLQITGAAPLGVTREGEITLVERSAKLQKITPGTAAAAIVPREMTIGELPIVQVDDVHAAFAKVVAYFRPPRVGQSVGLSPRAAISPTARIADDVDIHPGAVIGDDTVIGAGCVIHSGVHIMAGCRLEDHVTIFPGAVLYENTVVGPRVIIHSGAVIGAFGFGYRLHNGRHLLSAQLGYVELCADVEVGANTTIDRGTYGPTVIGEGTKIDNQVMIAHNCRIGRHNLICSQVGIAGSTSTGDNVVCAGQAGVRDHVHIGDGAILAAMAGVSNDVPAGVTMLGIPATPERDQKLCMAAYQKLPEMRKQLKALVKAIERIERQLGQGGGSRPAAA